MRVLSLATGDAHLKDRRCRIEVEIDGLERYLIRILHLEHAHDHLRVEKNVKSCGSRLDMSTCSALASSLAASYSFLKQHCISRYLPESCRFRMARPS